MKVDIFSDTVCPWCRIGKRHLFEALERDGLLDETVVEWRAFQLDPSVPAEGEPFRESLAQKFGGAGRMDEMFAYVCKVGEACDLPFHFGQIVKSPNTLLSHRLIKWTPPELRTAMVDAVMKAHFEDGRDIGDKDVLVAIAQETGAAAGEEAILRGLEDADIAREVEADLRFAAKAGISGVPYFIFDDKYAVSGAQPVEAFRRAFGQIRAKESGV